MCKKADIDKDVLSEMNIFLENNAYVGQPANPGDMLFIADSKWLKDTAVIERICKQHGAWDVALVFAHHKNPLKILVRHITRYYSENKARSAAFYMRKEAAKDGRGTLFVSISDLNLCDN
jgi:hypothetical protein